jgi:hypothetical protein
MCEHVIGGSADIFMVMAMRMITAVMVVVVVMRHIYGYENLSYPSSVNIVPRVTWWCINIEVICGAPKVLGQRKYVRCQCALPMLYSIDDLPAFVSYLLFVLLRQSASSPLAVVKTKQLCM